MPRFLPRSAKGYGDTRFPTPSSWIVPPFLSLSSRDLRCRRPEFSTATSSHTSTGRGSPQIGLKTSSGALRCAGGSPQCRRGIRVGETLYLSEDATKFSPNKMPAQARPWFIRFPSRSQEHSRSAVLGGWSELLHGSRIAWRFSLFSPVPLLCRHETSVAVISARPLDNEIYMSRDGWFTSTWRTIGKR